MDRVDLVKNKAQDTAKKAKKGASYLIYSRTAVVVVLLLAQVMFMIAMVNYLQKYMSAIYFMLAIFSAVMIIYILNEKGNPVVVFAAYEIAPGAFGAQEFEIVP